MSVGSVGSLAHIQTLESYLSLHNEVEEQRAKKVDTPIEPVSKKYADNVAISKEGSRLSSLLSTEGLFGFKPEKEGCVSIGEIESHAREYLTDLNGTLQDLFSANGIDTSQEIELGHEYGTGNVIVKNDHPDKAQIEQLFADDFDLRNEYTKITNMLTLAAEGKDASQFHEAYSKNPEQAVRDYAYLFNSHIETTVTILDDAINATFDRVSG